MVSISKPVVGGSSGTWGTTVNAALDVLASAVTILQNAVFNVKDYGALGDDSHNDTSAIEAAIAAAESAGGGVVFFPPGTYKIDTMLNVDADGVYLVGSGPQTTTLQSTSGTMDVVQFGNGSTTRTHVGISDMRFNNSSGQKTAGTGISITKCFKVWITRMAIQQQYRAFEILNSTMVWVTYCDIRETKEHGFYIDAALNSGFDWWLTDVLMDNIDVTSIGSGIHWLGGEGLHCNSVNAQRFLNGLYINAQDTQECRFGFLNMFVADTSINDGIYIDNTGSGNVTAIEFSNCWSATNGLNGMRICENGSGDVQGIKWMGGRIIHNNRNGVTMEDTPLDIHLNGTEIIGNSQETSNTYDGVLVTTALNNWSVINCRIGGGYNQGTGQRYAVRVDAVAADYYRILGNDVNTGNTTGGISDNGTGTHKSVANNV